MERDRQIKLAVAGVIGLAAVVILAMNIFGSNAPKPVEVQEQPAAKQTLGRGESPRPEK